LATFFVDRLPASISEDVDEDPTGNKLLYERGYLQGAPHKLTQLVNFYLGDTIVSMRRCTLVTGGREIILYVTLLGKIGIMIPFQTREDVDFFQSLEMHLRSETPPSCGRDHLAYRSYYFPVKSVVDGDLCELFNQLPLERRRAIAEEFDRTPAEIAKKMEDMRSLVAF